MGGIESQSALLGDPMFSQTNKKYDIPSNKRICADLRVDPTRTSVSCTARITDLVMFLSFTITEVLGRSRSVPIRQQCCQTLQVRHLQTRAVSGRTKETFLDSSETSSASTDSSIGLCPTRRTGLPWQGCHV